MKNTILREIKRTAAENGGKPLGVDRFTKETGISTNQWYGKYWTKWSDAILEAGFKPNEFNKNGYGAETLLAKLAKLTSELGHFPTKAELGVYAFNHDDFPGEKAYRNKFGNKSDIARNLMTFCKSKQEFTGVVEICNSIISNEVVDNSEPDEIARKEDKVGFVYLIKVGKHYKIGKSWSSDRRLKEIQLQLPERATKIHEIKTDDIDGIERYWHERFREKRKNGEWFELSGEEIRIFKKRKFM